MFKRILFVLLCLLYTINSYAVENEQSKTKERTLLLLQCKDNADFIKNRLESINLDLADFDKWKVLKNEYYYYIPFGTNWSDLEEACYAYPMYIQKSIYTMVVPYVTKEECYEGIYGKGKRISRELAGGYLIGKYTNHYNEQTQNCKINVEYMYVEGMLTRDVNSKRRTCEMSKKHFYNLITNPNYGKEGYQKLLQKRQCKEINKKDWETRTGMSTDELYAIYGSDVI